MKLTITTDGFTFTGKPCYYVDPVDEEDWDPRVNSYGVEIDEDSHFAGFFTTEEEARQWATNNGHTIEN